MSKSALAVCAAIFAALPSTRASGRRTLAPGRLDDTLNRVDRALAGGRTVWAMNLGSLARGGPKQSLAPYFAEPADPSKEKEGLPLESTSAEVRITGVIARVRVRQVYRNRGSKPIEALYVFPASTRAAVHGMRMRIGHRVVEAKIQRRAEARATYERAKREGRRTALLEQQRPNVFTMQVANIMPGEKVAVELDYSELLVPESSTYEFVYPVVVGPRYGGGADPKQDRWLANPYLKQGSPVPYRFDIQVRLDSPIGIKELVSPSHPVNVRFLSRNSAMVTLKNPAGSGNRDFVLRYRLAGSRIETGVLAYEAGGEKFFLAMIEPPKRVARSTIPPREYIFVLDVSGSMYGFPLKTAKALVRQLLAGLRQTDYFNILFFAGGSAVLSQKSLRATPENVARAWQAVSSRRGGGGTELMAALRRAYRLPRPKRHISRSIVVITDGYVAVERQAFRFIRKHLNEANCFSFGIGSSVNRGLIEGMARAGLGEPFVVLKPAQASSVAARFVSYVKSPVLTDIRARFSGLRTTDVAPKQLPDLLAERPLVIYGRYTGPFRGVLEISGQTGAGPFRKRIQLLPSMVEPSHAAIRVLWARKWVETLSDQLAMLPRNQDLKQAITNLGLEYHLLTRYTSFVAVDSQRVNRSGKLVSVSQPLPLPQGVSNFALGGRAGYGGVALRRSRGRPMRALEALPPSPLRAKAKAEDRDRAARIRGFTVQVQNLPPRASAVARALAERLARAAHLKPGSTFVLILSRGKVQVRGGNARLRRIVHIHRATLLKLLLLARKSNRPVVIRVRVR